MNDLVADLFLASAKQDKSIVMRARDLFAMLQRLEDGDRVETLNAIHRELHKYSPFSSEPVDCIQWIRADLVTANDYNPNSVAPPEMRLLEHSIGQDGYTQPIVAWQRDGLYEVVDGFHRNRVGKECESVRSRVRGYLPLAIINTDRLDRGDRIAATIRHNRARGKHKVDAMSDIVVELKRRNWSDDKIGRELGMDPDEVLRLCQITGLAEAFKDHSFSAAWEAVNVDDSALDEEIISDVIADYEAADGDRILHTYDKWECYRHGFYSEKPPGEMTQDQGEELYREFLADLPRFEAALQKVTSEWKHSCEHYLTNDRMNRIAWLGQASVACALAIPSMCRGGYHRLTEQQKYDADMMALKYLNAWLTANGRQQVMRAEATGRTEAELY